MHLLSSKFIFTFLMRFSTQHRSFPPSFSKSLFTLSRPHRFISVTPHLTPLSPVALLSLVAHMLSSTIFLFITWPYFFSSRDHLTFPVRTFKVATMYFISFIFLNIMVRPVFASFLLFCSNETQYCFRLI